MAEASERSLFSREKYLEQLAKLCADQEVSLSCVMASWRTQEMGAEGELTGGWELGGSRFYCSLLWGVSLPGVGWHGSKHASSELTIPLLLPS